MLRIIGRAAGISSAVCVAFTSWAMAGVIDTVAGSGVPENNGDRGPAVEINVGDPFGVEIGPDGALYVTEVRNHRVRRVDLATGEISTVAGDGRQGYSGDGGAATEASLNEPYEVRFDSAGNMFFVEMKNHVVRRVDGRTGIITTIAGTGVAGYGGDGGPAAKAMFKQPHSIALDDQGHLYVADIGNHRIRCIDLNTGIVDSVAGTTEKRLPLEGQLAEGTPILGPRALFIDGATMWIALREGHSVWRMNLQQGRLHHVAGTGGQGTRVTVVLRNWPRSTDRRASPSGPGGTCTLSIQRIRRFARLIRTRDRSRRSPAPVSAAETVTGTPLRSLNWLGLTESVLDRTVRSISGTR